MTLNMMKWFFTKFALKGFEEIPFSLSTSMKPISFFCVLQETINHLIMKEPLLFAVLKPLLLFAQFQFLLALMSV